MIFIDNNVLEKRSTLLPKKEEGSNGDSKTENGVEEDAQDEGKY